MPPDHLDARMPRDHAFGLAWLLAVALGSALAFAIPLGLVAGGAGLTLSARYSARVSFAAFLVVYSASALVRIVPSRSTRQLARCRRQLGLAFALAHGVHLIALLRGLASAGRPLASLVPGIVGYSLLFAMAVTSSDSARARLGAHAWGRLHAVGLHVLWFLFAASYARRIVDPEHVVVGTLGFAAALLPLGLRAWGRHLRPGTRLPGRRKASSSA